MAQNFILPLARFSEIWVDSYRLPSIFLLKGPIQSKDHSGSIPKRELKDPDILLLDMKLAPKLLYSCNFDQQGKWKNSYMGKEVLTQQFECLILHFKN